MNLFIPLYEAGLAYQIQDDLVRFSGIKERGLPGRDLKEGKMNVLIMHFLENATNGEKISFKQFFSKKIRINLRRRYFKLDSK